MLRSDVLGWRGWRGLLTLSAGALLVLLAVVPITLSQPSKAATWLIALWLCWGFTLLWALIQRHISPPAIGLLAIMLQYVMIPATRAVLTGRTIIAGVDYTPGTEAALQISVAAQLGLTAGLIGVRRFRRGSNELRRVAVEVTRQRLNLSAIAIMGVTAATLVLLTVTSGADLSKFVALIGTSSYGAYASSAVSTISGYLASITRVAGVCLLVAVTARSVRKQQRAILPVLLALVAAAFLIAGGQRVDLAIPALAAGMLWIKIRSGRRPLPMRTVTLAAIGGLLVIGGVVGVARSPAAQPVTAGTVIDSQFGQGSDLFAPLAGLAQTVPAQQNYLMGSSYLEALYFPIPRALWPGKPQGAIIGVLGSFSNVTNGESFPEYGEMYANFGAAGVILGCAFFAALMEGMWIRFAASTDKRGLFVYPVLIAIMLQLFTRDDAVSQLAGLLGLLIGALMLQRYLKPRVVSRVEPPRAVKTLADPVLFPQPIPAESRMTV
jgi:hypothetical protein